MLIVLDSPRTENGSELMVVPVVLDNDEKVTVKLLANRPIYNYELTKNGDYMEADENKVSAAGNYMLSSPQTLVFL